MLRIYDANFNRCSEGLRVLEDTARFLLNDTGLTERLKHTRHQLAKYYRQIEPQLLALRDSANDVGVQFSLNSEYERADMPSIVAANARRAQQSLRVIEELAKLPDSAIRDAADIEKMRFDLYDLEKELVSGLLRKDKLDRLNGVYLVLDHDFLRGRSDIDVAQQAIEGGVKVIQLRDKHRSKNVVLEIARELKEICAESNVLFILNDYIDVALAANADGVHLGQTDMPVDEARKMMPIDKIIGCSTATVPEAVLAEEQGADYIAVGSMYPTQSKQKIRLAGVETLKQIKQKIAQPIVAIGGINADNIDEVLASGADAVAVISVIMNREDVKAAASELAAHFENEGE